MIQRKQSLFLFQSIFLSVALLFVPAVQYSVGSNSQEISLSSFENTAIHSTGGHLAAIAINFLLLSICTLTVFLYKRRELQVKLCYSMVALWLLLAGMIFLCPFAQSSEAGISTVHLIAPIICLVAVVALFFAQRFIKKDIELLRSADRIR